MEKSYRACRHRSLRGHRRMICKGRRETGNGDGANSGDKGALQPGHRDLPRFQAIQSFVAACARQVHAAEQMPLARRPSYLEVDGDTGAPVIRLMRSGSSWSSLVTLGGLWFA